jgi:hypothetical protein
MKTNGGSAGGAYGLRGLDVIDCRGEGVGTVVDVHMGETGRDPRWARVKPAGNGGHAILVPLAGAAIVEGQVELAISVGELTTA